MAVSYVSFEANLGDFNQPSGQARPKRRNFKIFKFQENKSTGCRMISGIQRCHLVFRTASVFQKSHFESMISLWCAIIEWKVFVLGFYFQDIQLKLVALVVD